MMELQSRRLHNWWQDKLNENMENHFPDVIGSCTLVESWMQDGWNDHTATLIGVYQDGVKYLRCTFPDCEAPKRDAVKPVFQHVGWATPNE